MSSDDENERLSHERRVKKKKMQDVFNYYGKPEINDKDVDETQSGRNSEERSDDNNNNNNNNTVIEYWCHERGRREISFQLLRGA